ncbi:MAG: hypothetical protein ABEJ67_02855 [Halanaeroarchaeum sp.]
MSLGTKRDGEDAATTDGRGLGRRAFLTGIAGAAATAGLASLAGCTGGGGGGAVDEEVYVVAFHWGFRLVRPDGTVMDSMDLASGTRVAIHGINLEPIADGADVDLPDPVAAAANENYHQWERESLERIAPLMGVSVENLEGKLETAEEQYKDHGMALSDPSGSTLFDVTLPGDMSAPKTETVTVDASGGYDLTCTTNCGVGHTYMELQDAFRVS